MSLPVKDRKRLRRYIIHNVTKYPDCIVKKTIKKFGVTRQAVSRYVYIMLDEGVLEQEGHLRNIRYSLKPTKSTFTLKVLPGMEEDKVWRESVLPHMPKMTKTSRNLCQYGFGQILNNVIDHSKAKEVTVHVNVDAVNVEMIVIDKGVGIYKKIQEENGLEDPKQALLELSKGKIASDPENHTGEGIFFTSKMFEEFDIYSDNLYLSNYNNGEWLPEGEKSGAGTAVFMKINRESALKLSSVIEEFTLGERGPGFSKTVVPMKVLLHEGEAPVSRSQAKRLVTRFDRFKEVALDFGDIDEIGQPFADEIFRVFQNKHPEVKLSPVNANHDVSQVIRHARSHT